MLLPTAGFFQTFFVLLLLKICLRDTITGPARFCCVFRILYFKPIGQVRASPKPFVLAEQQWTGLLLLETLQLMEKYFSILEACMNPGTLWLVVDAATP